jgi:hypothetical protein
MRAAAFVVCSCFAAITASAQQPSTVNARIVARAAKPDVRQAIGSIVKDQADPAWIGYAVPVIADASGIPKNDDGWSERCRLEQTPAGTDNARGSVPAGPVRLEPSPTIMVLLRVQNREMQRIRSFSSDCQIDAGGLPLFWLDGAAGADSVAFLKTLIGAGGVRSLSEQALSAIARHKDPAATALLLDLARTSATARLRERSLFWIAQRAESRALATIGEAIERDPDVAVKKQAVFALSRLPNGEGVPLLITLARSSPQPDVRKQAMFWLGQSKDPRALSFFEDILR